MTGKLVNHACYLLVRVLPRPAEVRGAYAWLLDRAGRHAFRFRPKGTHGCWTIFERPHPWVKSIKSMACGFDERMTHRKCSGCHRRREESPLDQLQALDARHTEDGLIKEPT